MCNVFVSYSHLDGEKVFPIVERLKSAGYSCWIDRSGIRGGDVFRTKIVKAIKEASLILFFSSKNANDSKWTAKEIAVASELGKTIIPIRLDNSEYSDSIHLELSGVQYISVFGIDIEVATQKLIDAIKHSESEMCIFQDITFTLKNNVKLEMVYCPPGEFMMGSPEDELGHHENEWLHKVRIESGFWIGRFPVTEEQCSVFDGSDQLCHMRYPCVKRSWYGARVFCQQLLDKITDAVPSGYHFALPTEAQWEYACRAGTTSALNSGEELTNIKTCYHLDALGWYAANHGGFYKWQIPVGQKKPNAWGLYDMHGLVWEWCDDSFGFYGHEKPANSTKIIRGGAWDSVARGCRSANRYSCHPEVSDSRIGFRIALVK